MKKINSIWFGSKLLLAVGIFLASALGLHIAILLFGWSCLNVIVIISLAISAAIFFVFLIILAVESAQDRTLNKRYLSRKASKIQVTDIYFECQNCGNQKVLLHHRRCSVCGIRFDQKC